MARCIEVLLAPPWPAEAVRGAHVAVVDVLRATTTIATALANGALGVIPVADALAHEAGDVVIVCAGEAQGFVLEDALGAGALVDMLLTLIADVELCGGARDVTRCAGLDTLTVVPILRDGIVVAA